MWDIDLKTNSAMIKTQKWTKKYGTVEVAEDFLACLIEKEGKKPLHSWSYWNHIEPIQAVYLAYAVWQ